MTKYRIEDAAVILRTDVPEELDYPPLPDNIVSLGNGVVAIGEDRINSSIDEAMTLEKLTEIVNETGRIPEEYKPFFAEPDRVPPAVPPAKNVRVKEDGRLELIRPGEPDYVPPKGWPCYSHLEPYLNPESAVVCECCGRPKIP